METASFSDQKYCNRVVVAHFRGFRARELRCLEKSLGDFGDALNASRERLSGSGVSTERIDAFCEWRDSFNPERALAFLDSQKIRCVFKSDADYPPLLREISDPPEVLFIRAAIPPGPCVSFVGSRKYSFYGQVCVNLLIPDAVRSGIVTVSGLALGIDGLVHKKTITAGGKTIAVLGTGIDDHSIYPRNNTWIAREIIENGGCLISEFPPGTPGRKEHFPIRNRIIAGISRATVVIEAGEKSGSLITARLAIEENRDVFSVPGPITKTSSAGTNLLLKMGAQPCLDFTSVLEGIELDLPAVQSSAEIHLPLSLLEREVLEQLEEKRHIDALADITGMDHARLAPILTSLELKGRVENLGGQLWKTVRSLPEEKKKCYNQVHHVKTSSDR